MQKLYYSISEVSTLIDEEQHILRYWQKEFPQLKPKKNRSGNRVYSDKDLSLLKLIKKILREDKKTLKDAKEYIDELFKRNDNWDNSLFFDYEIDTLTKDSEIATTLQKDKPIKKISEKPKKTKVNTESNTELIEFLNSLATKIKQL